tara:strand:+ start:144 stop:350 length:207 start_codon:yes stop_codon:yes gene_type:complete
MGFSISKKKQIENWTKDCMKKGPPFPGKKSMCKYGAKKAYNEMEKQKKKNEANSIKNRIINKKKKMKF